MEEKALVKRKKQVYFIIQRGGEMFAKSKQQEHSLSYNAGKRS